MVAAPLLSQQAFTQQAGGLRIISHILKLRLIQLNWNLGYRLCCSTTSSMRAIAISPSPPFSPLLYEASPTIACDVACLDASYHTTPCGGDRLSPAAAPLPS